jgi:hydroxyacylglutathione hydrolase
MKQLAPGVWRLHEFPAPITNCYLAGDVLVDTGRRWDRGRIFKELEGRTMSLVALTHVHPDHQGSAHAVCEARNIPLACHEDDVAAMEGRRPINEPILDTGLTRFLTRLWQGPAHPVARVLREGDVVAGFRVVHAPGHSRGEVIYFREHDRVAICGDVIRNISFLTLRSGLREPLPGLTYDIPENRRSIRKLANLNPSLILPGHGPEVTDMAAFARFVRELPA